ncbi:MAG TPA: Ig-like domain-containing protein [Trebonia sp.]|nr:Ig-like domain-containing protein [Trebonia sp.]
MSQLKPARVAGKAIAASAATAIVGVALLSGSAHAAGIASGPGLTVTPASGSSNVQGSYASTACPAGFQGSAQIRAVYSDPSLGSPFSVSAVNNQVTSAFTGTFFPGSTMAQFYANAGYAGAATEEFIAYCFSGASAQGTSTPAFDDWVTWSADGSTYTTSATAPAGPPATTTTLTASPSTAQAGATVTLTATVTSSAGTPAGTVQFEDGGTLIGSPVTLDASGTASAATSFTVAGSTALSAVFTPADPNAFSGSTGTASESIIPSGGFVVTEPLQVTVPATGTFNFVATGSTGTVILTPTGTTAPLTATGTANTVEVQDSRNTYPGWNVTGQSSDFTEPASTPAGDIPGSDLGWKPTGTPLDGATLGPVVAAGAPGLGAAALLASAAAGNGFGNSDLGTDLTLNIPNNAPPGVYGATLTLTALPSPAA